MMLKCRGWLSDRVALPPCVNRFSGPRALVLGSAATALGAEVYSPAVRGAVRGKSDR